MPEANRPQRLAPQQNHPPGPRYHVSSVSVSVCVCLCLSVSVSPSKSVSVSVSPSACLSVSVSPSACLSVSVSPSKGTYTRLKVQYRRAGSRGYENGLAGRLKPARFFCHDMLCMCVCVCVCVSVSECVHSRARTHTHAYMQTHKYSYPNRNTLALHEPEVLKETYIRQRDLYKTKRGLARETASGGTYSHTRC